MRKYSLGGRILCLGMLLAAVFLAELPVQSYGASKYVGITAKAKKQRKKAPELKLDTIYRVTQKKNKSMIRFTPKEKGTYVFTIARLKSRNGSKAVGDFCIYRDSVAGLIPMTVKTKGGKAKVLRIAAANTYKKPKKVQTVNYLKKRTGQLKLKKGYSYLVELNYTDKEKGKACTYLVKVEKK